MNTPLVSVLLTSYNREAFIAESIESVLAQTLTDFELIVSDDQSRDGTVAIASDYARRDARIRVSVNERNPTVRTRGNGRRIGERTFPRSTRAFPVRPTTTCTPAHLARRAT